MVDNTNHIQLHPIQVGRNFGGTMQVLSGASESDRVVNNPPDSIASGELVHVTGDKGGA